MPRVMVFDDGHDLGPLAGLRATFEVRTGALTTLDRIRAALGTEVGLVVPEPLAPLMRERYGAAVNPALSGAEPVLVINGRAPLGVTRAAALEAGSVLVERSTNGVVAGLLPPSLVADVVAGRRRDLSVTMLDGLHLLSRPWHVRLLRDACLGHDLARLAGGVPRELPGGVLTFGVHRLSIGAAAAVYPGVTFDLESGPIVIDEAAVVRTGAIVIGPAYIGPHSTVLERATVRANTAIGPWCKVAGEVGGTVFQGYTNKAHDGYLGDSWVGEWVNLGAGTTNSNLLNTYAEVKARATPDGPEEPAGERFVGAFIGDHVKTAIGTRIMTGAVIGTGSMIGQSAQIGGCVPAFSWCTDAGRDAYRLDRFIDAARAVMARRQVTPSAAYIGRVSDLHAERAGGGVGRG